MKKKKPPVIALTLVCVGIGVAFALNVKARPVDPAEQAREMSEKNAGKQADETPASIGGMTKQSMKATGPESRTVKKGAGDGFIVAERPKMFKPQKSDSATSSLWYKN